MDIAVTGSTGFIGTPLVGHLTDAGHRVLRLIRPDSPGGSDTAAWNPATGTIDRDALEGIDAVIHLAGEPIAASRWTVAQKERILTSRRAGTELLADTLAGLDRPPRTLLSASAIGIYGNTGDRPIDETGPLGNDFPAEVCRVWERSTTAASDAGIGVTHLRTGIVLDPEGGALARQLPFFRFGLGGRSGSGHQYQSWISLRDELAAIAFLLDAELSGPVNLVAPHPVTNAEFARTLGRVLHRPTSVIPMIGPRLLFGRELADSLLLTSQRIVPSALQRAGFAFSDPDIEPALRSMLRR